MQQLGLVMYSFALLFALYTTGCGAGTKQDVDIRATTKGQELQDLHEARKKGLLTDKEYEQQKKQILKKK